MTTKPTIDGVSRYDISFYGDHMEKGPDGSYVHVDDYDAAQATIAKLEAKVNNAINLDFERRETIAKLESRIAGLERGRGELVAEIISKFGDPEAFGERELISATDISKFPYGTRLYACLDATAALNGVKP